MANFRMPKMQKTNDYFLLSLKETRLRSFFEYFFNSIFRSTFFLFLEVQYTSPVCLFFSWINLSWDIILYLNFPYYIKISQKSKRQKKHLYGSVRFKVRHSMETERLNPSCKFSICSFPQFSLRSMRKRRDSVTNNFSSKNFLDPDSATSTRFARLVYRLRLSNPSVSRASNRSIAPQSCGLLRCVLDEVRMYFGQNPQDFDE
jgi:hypothetical protein